MVRLMDDPPEAIPAEIALVVRAEFESPREAYTEVTAIQIAVTELLEQRWPTARIDLAQATVGQVDEQEQAREASGPQLL